ncbi:hypothetical protein EYF80_048936 [Liparis tanakae]|uniref:Uncharacterized protein n=1 Tax=Liparis tanakae TaxID=230148 RepID=A0A4Z2FKT2_9TELE|nr:hypothetical protein EYF80_048936 [Liparis tanakae]
MEDLRHDKRPGGADVMVVQISIDHGLKIEDLIWLAQGLKGEVQLWRVLCPVQISVNWDLKQDLLRVLVLTGEYLEFQISGDWALTGEVILWRVLGQTGEDVEVLISGDQGLKAEAYPWRVLGLTGEDLEVQMSGV